MKDLIGADHSSTAIHEAPDSAKSRQQVFICAQSARSLFSLSHSISIHTLESLFLFLVSVSWSLHLCSSFTMRSRMFHSVGCEDHNNEPHFLEACFLCRKRLGLNSDIFMYRGNTPFCSTECRQEQIEIDEAEEKKSWKLSPSSTSSNRAVRKSDTNQDSTPNKAVRRGAVVVA